MFRRNAIWMIATLLMLAMLIPATAQEETAGTDESEPEDFGELGEYFESEGYAGEWTRIPELDFELCLPEGWTALEDAGEGIFAAERAEDGAKLTIGPLGDAVEDLQAWGEANLATYEAENVNFYDVLIEENAGDGTLTVYVNYLEDRLVAFRFEGGDAPIAREFALEVVGTAYPYHEGEDIFADFLGEVDYFNLPE